MESINQNSFDNAQMELGIDPAAFAVAAEVVEDYSQMAQFGSFDSSADNLDQAVVESVWYMNVASCPDCTAGMVSQGGCFSCPACGYSCCG